MTIMVVFIFGCCIILALLFFFAIRSEAVYRNQLAITRAIYDYYVAFAVYDHFEVKYTDMEPYKKTYWRLWDWSYKRILPPDKFELIKDYIKE